MKTITILKVALNEKLNVEIWNSLEMFPWKGPWKGVKKRAVKGTKVRVLWDEEREKWYFSIVDVAGVLSESDNPRKYWSVLKTRLKAEGRQLATNCSQLENEG